MIVVNLADGRTLRLDLSDPVTERQWKESQVARWFQDQIRAIGISVNGTLHTLQAPSRFRETTFNAKLVFNGDKVVAECVSCQADDIEANLTVYVGDNRVARYGMTKIGRKHYDPNTQGPRMGYNQGTR